MTNKWKEPEEVHASFVLLLQEENIRLAASILWKWGKLPKVCKSGENSYYIKRKKIQNVKQVR